MPENKKVFPPPSRHEVEWIDGTIPRSLRFGDTYFSQAGGADETLHVFINWNELPARWPRMRHCTIAELGFGTGLNFLETLCHWRAMRAPGATLDYISFEAFPMERDDLDKSLSRWPHLAADAAILVDAWHPQAEQIDVEFEAGIHLTIHQCDAAAALPKLTFEADAWYLDGFAPSRNPDMWSAGLMGEVFRHTKPGGSFATYTSAGWVRRNLEAAGFAVEKRAGFAGKREMLCGRKT
jgi:tRNA U34 5-methylaminomethyl-2-thiouridine-forming methyltransferase MnmC